MGSERVSNPNKTTCSIGLLTAQLFWHPFLSRILETDFRRPPLPLDARSDIRQTPAEATQTPRRRPSLGPNNIMKLTAALYFGVLFAALAAASATAGEAEEADVAAAPLEPLFADSEDEERMLEINKASDNIFTRLARSARSARLGKRADLGTDGLRRRDARRHGAAVPSDGEDRDLESEAEELDSEDFNYFGVPMP